MGLSNLPIERIAGYTVICNVDLTQFADLGISTAGFEKTKYMHNVARPLILSDSRRNSSAMLLIHPIFKLKGQPWMDKINWPILEKVEIGCQIAEHKLQIFGDFLQLSYWRNIHSNDFYCREFFSNVSCPTAYSLSYQKLQGRTCTSANIENPLCRRTEIDH